MAESTGPTAESEWVGTYAPRCPRCGWQAPERRYTEAAREALGAESQADVVAHKAECPGIVAAHDTYTHGQDGRVCIVLDDGWFVPLDAGGEGFACMRHHGPEPASTPVQVTRCDVTHSGPTCDGPCKNASPTNDINASPHSDALPREHVTPQ